jgi:hypothetical protein
MKRWRKAPPLARFLFHVVVFIVSVFCVSNMMALLLQAATEGITITDGLLTAGYALVSAATIVVLARAIYQLDRKAGRIRNRVGLFE